MYALSNDYGAGLWPADIQLKKSTGPLSSLTYDQHEKLLNYLINRLKSANVGRNVRLFRYSRIDRMISTWQKLTPEDTKREITEDNTGRQQAISMNLPILATHLEDTVAFYGEVFSSQTRDFYTVPSKDQSDAAKALSEKMNRDTKARKYYKELILGLRALNKYNIGGYAVRWESGGGQGQMAEPGNRIESIDMYNYIWDPNVNDPSRIPWDAEFDARFTVKSKMWLERAAMRGDLERVTEVFEYNKGRWGDNSGSKKSAFYRFPPNQIGLSEEGQDEHTSSTQTVDWAAYGAALANDTAPDIPGFEVAEMHCWLNPVQFGLTDTVAISPDATDKRGQGYSLWRFTIVDGCQVCAAEQIPPVADTTPEIPHYIGFMTIDDTRQSQRSVMELMRPFQRFASFLANIYVTGMRKNIWGTKGVDPSMFDTSKLEGGDVAVVLHSKVPGRDVRTGLMTLDSNPGVEKSFEGLQAIMELIQRLFPSQAMPAQIASIDRAVKNQVAAVMQGVTRRLHMTCKTLDSDIMAPMRLQCYRNLSQKDPEGLTGLTEEVVARILGSGLNQLNREAVASEVKEIIYAIIQNPEAAQFYDIVGLMNYWSQLMDSPSDLGEFAKPQQPAAVPGAPGVPGAPPGVLGASGLAGAPAPTVPAVA